jgi:hypothetical protein
VKYTKVRDRSNSVERLCVVCARAFHKKGVRVELCLCCQIHVPALLLRCYVSG